MYIILKWAILYKENFHFKYLNFDANSCTFNLVIFFGVFLHRVISVFT